MNKKSIFVTSDGKDYRLLFASVTSLFLLWGFAHSLLDILNKHFQDTLHITKAKSGLVQMAVYGAYFLMAMPAGWIARRYGYQRGIVVGLTLFALGAFWFYPASRIGTFTPFLLGLFVLALGLTCLETVANPYAIVLGPAEMASSRINLAQTFNGFGWVMGPLVGLVIFPHSRGEAAGVPIEIPYLLLAVVVTLMAFFFSRVKMPDLQPDAHSEHGIAATEAPSSRPLWRRPHFVCAVAAQFFYVAAQTGVGSFFINYIVENLRGWSAWDATLLLSFGGMGVFVLGRLLGSFILRRAEPERVLALFGGINVVLMAVVMAGWGVVSAAALVACYFFMSVMFPTIFSLGLRGLGTQTKKGASPLVMAVVGGAVAPFLMGEIADAASMRIGFLVPLVCFGAIALYAAAWRFLYAKSL